MKQYILRILFVLPTWLSAAQAQVISVDAIGITVRDMRKSEQFYREVLGFSKVSETEVYGEEYEKLQGLFGIRMKVVRMRLGDEFIELTDYLTIGGRSIPEDSRSNDLFFQHIAIVVSDMEKAYQHLRSFDVEHVSTGPQTIPQTNTAAAGIKAFYFKDPDGHSLELIFFPVGKGQPKWQKDKRKVFLGIDHTAIAIGNTDRSLNFYQRLLGMERRGDSWNSGTEQEHLNAVEGASLHITGLRSTAGAGIEFLEYLQPGPGRPFPHDSRADDLWHWQVIVTVTDSEGLYNRLVAANAKLISQGVISFNRGGKKYKSFVVRDPDGHAVQLIESVPES
jgi:catechol 2,3-dioxygenase-like lactoylglutathione lyase family enzyme